MPNPAPSEISVQSSPSGTSWRKTRSTAAAPIKPMTCLTQSAAETRRPRFAETARSIHKD